MTGPTGTAPPARGPRQDPGMPWIEPGAGWPEVVGTLTTTRSGPYGAKRSGPYGWNLADHVGDAPRAVAGHRRELARLTRIAQVQWLNQVHGTVCIEASQASVDTVPRADAAWTAERGIGLAVLTADCVPAVLCDRAGTVVGVAHGGWRGLVDGVIESLVTALPVAPGQLIAWLGPAISRQAYQVGGEVVARITACNHGAHLVERCVAEDAEPDRFRVDLFALAEALLRQAGVGQVMGSGSCTFADPRFFSYRRSAVTGRMATLAWLR